MGVYYSGISEKLTRRKVNHLWNNSINFSDIPLHYECVCALVMWMKIRNSA